MFSLPVDYFLLALSGCCGVIQVAAAYSRMYGLLFLPGVRASYLVGVTLVAGAFTWFILVGDAKVPGDVGGVEGSEQFALFFGAASVSVIVCPLISSLTQLGRRGKVEAGLGMEALRQATLLQVLVARIRRRGRHGGG